MDDENDAIDPELRLRTVRTAHSTLEESIRTEDRARRRRTMMRKRSKGFFRRGTDKKRVKDQSITESPPEPSAAPPVTGLRRNIYVNMPLPPDELDSNGEPVVRYVRNKVRTSKYTILTFVPRNLYEQFRRVANLYFLAVVIVQIFPVFGAPSPQTGALPLLFIIVVTAIKDAIEDYRRAVLDEEVNNSASTKLGQWQNVNQPADPRSWFERLLRLNPPGRVTKGVRKLREREAGEGKLQIVLSKDGDERTSGVTSAEHSTQELGFYAGAGGRTLEAIPSIDSQASHKYPPQQAQPEAWRGVQGALDKNYEPSLASRPSDGAVDYRKRVTGMARWERTLWKKLEVGDIVLLRENEQVPADIVVLSTSDAENMCYVETKNLDGETNLKPRKSVRATSSITSEEDVERMRFVLDSEPPHQNLYVYHGVFRYTDPTTGEQKQEAVGINELLLRGCTVRNTAWIIGLVVFTGADSKIMLNGGETPSKRSKIEQETNFNVVVNFVLLAVMCIISAIGSGWWDAQKNTSAKVFEMGVDPTGSFVVNAIVTFASCLIAFQNIVPISLYISIEIVKTIQAFFISQDVDMYYKPLDAACTPKTWNISDDLGQIEYIFSDKTGTLTQNVMEFQKCSVNGQPYGEGVTEAQRGAAKREGKDDLMDPEEQDRQLRGLKADMLDKMSRAFKNRYLQSEKVTLISPKLADDLADRSSTQRPHLIAFFRALALCHSVLADRPEPNTKPFHLEYKAESPDEAALVAAARDIGFPFVGKSKDTLEIEVMGQVEKYTLLQLIEFNSTRKRMSVIVRNPQGQIVLYTKGADSVIYQRLAADHDPELKARTSHDMEAFANGGLRTLCIASRNVAEEEYLEWQRIYDAATNAIVDRDEEIDKATEKIEHSLYILGATALEDKLQEGVPEAIETLHKAGIKLWILTGDKVQTAIEIGFSCNLLKSDMEVMILSADTPESTQMQIEAGINKINSVLGPPKLNPSERGFIPGAQQAFAVVIDGDTLRHALTPALKPLFLNLATQCETVVCCRVSPAQKALVVKLVKEGRNAMTLSIGDGANDVAMIQEANVGCGLLGHEGSQAAMSADYAFGQFRYLTKLLIVHGRWSYQRVADMHSVFFYKNVIWTFAMFWYLIYNSFDATYLYQYTFIILYNVVFTSLPVIVLGAFDQDINAKAALAFPQLYIRGIRGLEYTRTKFWLYMLDGLYQSLVVFYIPYFVWTLGPPMSWNGKSVESLSDFGTTVSVAAIWAANTYVGINTHYWTVITWVVVLGSSVVMFAWIVIYSYFPSSDFVEEVVVLCGQSIFWFSVIVSVMIALTPRFLVKFISTSYFPQDRDIVREMWVHGDLKEQLGIKHRRDMKRSAKSDIEQAPMFHRPHFRSESEVSSFHPEADRGTPPMPRSPATDSTHSSPSPNHRPSPLSAPHDDDLVTPTARQYMTPSPATFRGSYYSASNIPVPSPYPGQEPSMTSISQQPVTAHAPQPSVTLQVPALRNRPTQPQPSPEAYEMSVREPPDDAETPTAYHAQFSTQSTYATAYESAYDGGVEQEPHPSDDHRLSVTPPEESWRDSTYSTGTGHAI
ncbi:phospholipid-transporting ATPase [Phanerochaete sordida]|uniref:Phospholipid-transporting ATPase n=1 Tax=Phanerochaete sordida TaxID=48140 RepID=A0A9P3LM30_9APHY|nr:phospholipid-transporting ATPase [Phanerochaete sordida]